MLDETDLNPPQDSEAPIWRYMDFVRFMSLLANAALYFPRADRLNDTHEGAMPRRNIENQHIHLAGPVRPADSGRTRRRRRWSVARATKHSDPDSNERRKE